MQSSFTKQFTKLLNNKNIKIISFDIFDTLFFRKCFLPENIFELVGEHEYVKKYFETPGNFKKYRQHAEQNAREQYKDIEDITLEQIYNQFSISNTAKKQIKKIEIDTEEKNLMVNHDLERWISMATEAGKKVILISDMYLNQEQLIYVCLHKLKTKEKISNIYVSSEYGLTKAKGSLFLKVLQKESINPEQLLHIGDNKISDISSAHSLGINVLYYGYDKAAEQQFENEKVFIKKHLKDGNHIRKLAALQNPYNDDFKSFYYNFGSSTLGPILFGFSHWLNKLSETNQIDKYFFIMREGLIFQKYFTKLFPHHKTEIIYASRNSTHPITVDLDNISSSILGTQRSFTVSDLYKSLQIKIQDKIIYDNKNKMLSEANNIKINTKNLFQIVSEDINTRKEEIKKLITKQQSLINKYFNSLQITKKSLIVDFGSGGTILNRIKKIILKKDFPSINALFFMNERGFRIQSQNHTLPFLPYSDSSSKEVEAIARSPEIFEILLNLDLPTTINYLYKDGKSVPNTKTPLCNIKTIKIIKDSLLEGVDSFINTARLYNASSNCFTKENLLNIMSRVILLPTQEEVKSLQTLESDEGNNSQYIYKLVTPEQIKSLQDTGVEKMYFNFHKNKSIYRHEFPWIEAAITNKDSSLLKNLYIEHSSSNLNNKIVSNILDKVDLSMIQETYIYGAGNLFKELLPYLYERNIKILGVMDTKAEINDFEFQGYNVSTLNKTLKHTDSANVIIASGVFIKTIINNIDTYSKQTQKSINIIFMS